MLDAERITEWFEAHAAPLVLYARQWLGRGAAEDAVQEVFVRLMLQPAPPANLKAWLYRAVRNEAVGQWRSLRRRERRERDAAVAPDAEWFEPAPAELLDAEAAAAAIEDLPGSQREALVLRIWAGMTLQEIATLVGSPVSTVFHHYQQGLRAVQRKLGVPCDTKTTNAKNEKSQTSQRRPANRPGQPSGTTTA